jgi:hypothetical protein
MRARQPGPGVPGIVRPGRKNRGCRQPAVEAALALDLGFARLAGVARLVKRLEPAAHEQTRADGRGDVANVRQHVPAVVERKAQLGRTVAGTHPLQKGPGVSRRAIFHQRLSLRA